MSSSAVSISVLLLFLQRLFHQITITSLSLWISIFGLGLSCLFQLFSEMSSRLFLLSSPSKTLSTVNLSLIFPDPDRK